MFARCDKGTSLQNTSRLRNWRAADQESSELRDTVAT